MSASTGSGASQLGQRLRALRTTSGLSVRELARRAECSASLVSQVERGVAMPSAQTVYALSNVLGVSLDSLFGADDQPGPGELDHDHAATTTPRPARRSWGRATDADGEGIVQRLGERESISLAGGLRWDRLTPGHDARVDFLEVTYEPGASSSADGQSVHHEGREYLIVLEGLVEARVGSATLELSPGDTIAFDPELPHRYRNLSAERSRHVTVVVHDP